jgi:DNA-binding transcriptional LysR family regulator
MHDFDLRAIDLNLLVVLDVLMVERNVTRAAERLNRTQSAVSHSLSRLRSQLGDPLLIKSGGRMQATAFALDFIDQVRPILRGLQRAFAPHDAFDPAISQRIFRLAAPDFAIGLFVTILEALRTRAPGVAIEWTGLREATLIDIADGLIDFAIVPSQQKMPSALIARDIGALEWLCFGRHEHPAFGAWGPEAWSRYPHLVVRVGDQLESPVNIAAGAAGLTRTVSCWLPNFLAIAPVLSTTDLLATVPSLVMAEVVTRYRLDCRPVPFPIDPLPHAVIWSAARINDPDIRWLRGQVEPVFANHFHRRQVLQ